MTRDEALTKLKPCEAELRGMGLRALYLFGSVARNEPNPTDVDLAFEIGDAPDFSLLSQAGAQIRLEQILGRPVDLVQRDRLHEMIRPRIEADLVRVY